MRKTISFSDVEVGLIEGEGRGVGHRTFSACLRYCLRGLLGGVDVGGTTASRIPSSGEPIVRTARDVSKDLGIPLGDAAPFSKGRQVKGFGK